MYKNYTKISKAAARKAFDAGEQIYLHSSLMAWNNPWQNPCPVVIDIEQEKLRSELFKKYPNDIWTGKPNKFIPEFDLVSNEFRYYNCDKERGLRVIYLIENI